MSVGVYSNDRYTAYFYEKNIVICTRLQCFRISYLTRSHQALLDELALNIMRGRVRTLVELRDYGGVLRWENCSKPLLSQLELAF